MAYILELQKRNNNRFFQCGCLLSLSVDQILTTLKKDRILKKNQNSGRRRRKGGWMMNLHGLSSMNWGQNPSFFLSFCVFPYPSFWLANMLRFGLNPTAAAIDQPVDLQCQLKNSLHHPALVLFPTIFHLFLLQGWVQVVSAAAPIEENSAKKNLWFMKWIPILLCIKFKIMQYESSHVRPLEKGNSFDTYFSWTFKVEILLKTK